jgi:hypothetical protein
MEKSSGFGIGELGQTQETTPLDEIQAQNLQPRRKPDFPNGKKLDCGHTVYFRNQVMMASLGSSCEDCYDRMSD